MPIWETECAISSGKTNGEYHSAIGDARRLTLAAALGVQHTFLYDYCGPDIAQTVLDYWQAPRQRYFVEQRLYSLIGGMSPTGQTITAAGGEYVVFTGEEAIAGTLLDKLSASPAFVNLPGNSVFAPPRVQVGAA